MKKIYLIALASLMIILSGCTTESKNSETEAKLTAQEIKQITKEAYLHLSDDGTL